MNEAPVGQIEISPLAPLLLDLLRVHPEAPFPEEIVARQREAAIARWEVLIHEGVHGDLPPDPCGGHLDLDILSRERDREGWLELAAD